MPLLTTKDLTVSKINLPTAYNEAGVNTNLIAFGRPIITTDGSYIFSAITSQLTYEASEDKYFRLRRLVVAQLRSRRN